MQAFQRLAQHCQLRLAPHQAGAPAGQAVRAHRALAGGGDAEHAHRLGLALHRHGRQRLEVERTRRQGPGVRAGQDLAGAGQLAQARGHVDRVAHHAHGPGLRAAAGDHQPGVDAGVHRRPPPDASFQLRGEPFHVGVDLPGGVQGAHRVVLVGGGHAEHGHHRVADVLLDAALVAPHHAGHLGEQAPHHPLHLLRVQPLGHGRVAGEVAEQHRHLLALARGRKRGGLVR